MNTESMLKTLSKKLAKTRDCPTCNGKLENSTIKDIEDLVRETLGNDPVHGFPHVERVMKLAFKLAEEYKGKYDPIVLKLAVLLHDVGRIEEQDLHKHHAILSAEMAQKILEQYGFPKEIIEKIKDAILAHSFTLGYKPKTVEGMILSDADKLDALGAVGIMRVFMESAYRGRALDEAIDHFYEKLFKLKDLMWTRKGKELAIRRHEYMVNFLGKLEREIEGLE